MPIANATTRIWAPVARKTKATLGLCAAAMLLAGCLPAPTSPQSRSFALAPGQAPTFCQTYAAQTLRNAFEDNYSRGEGFGSRAFARASAERAAERAYARCLSGRLN